MDVPPDELVGFSDRPPWEEPPLTRQTDTRDYTERAAEAERRINEKLENPNGASFEADEAGLEKAYADPSGISYDANTRTEYIRGTTTMRDWYDDFTKIPCWG
jgi:hypothetical protein